MRTPIQKFAGKEGITTRFLYKEARRGRLILTKVGSRTFVDDVDAEQWRALAPKYNGTVGDVVMKVAEEKLKALGKAVADGHVDRVRAVRRLEQVARETGLTL
jgi:hypothetical protein